jgi:hypothetical protein
MPVIKVTVDDATYRRLVRKRKQKRLPSVSALLLSETGELSDELTAQEIVRRSLAVVAREPVGFEFRLKELFKRPVWEAFSKGARIRAGKLFAQRISAAQDGIVAARRSSSNHQFYRKTS